VWESFSEEEPEVKKVKAPSMTAPQKNNKKGQGNIMNFFGKK
jgi:DNA polymerase delta subunit 3